jgi:hypothetical protein
LSRAGASVHLPCPAARTVQHLRAMLMSDLRRVIAAATIAHDDLRTALA